MFSRDILDWTFRKRLPSKFGGGRIYASGRADARILKPGWSASAFDLMLVAEKFCARGSVVWDIGANMGILSAMAASRVGDKGAVYALEADPKYADMIFRTSQALGPKYQPISVLCAAISDCNGLLQFGISAKGHARNHIVSGDGSDLEAVKSVAAVCGDDLLQCWRAPSFIKMDVEGAEMRALQGCDKILTTVRPSFYIEVSEQNADAAADLFRSYDYSVAHLKGDGSEEPRDSCSFYTIARPRGITRAAARA